MDRSRGPDLPLGLKATLAPVSDRLTVIAQEIIVLTNNPTLLSVFLLALMLCGTSLARADTAEARCDIYPAGQDHTDTMMACTFSQRQGYIRIVRSDGVEHDLSPTGEAQGNYQDRTGNTVYRQSGLGDKGQIFRFPNESVYVYWSTIALEPRIEDKGSEPSDNTGNDGAG